MAKNKTNSKKEMLKHPIIAHCMEYPWKLQRLADVLQTYGRTLGDYKKWIKRVE